MRTPLRLFTLLLMLASYGCGDDANTANEDSGAPDSGAPDSGAPDAGDPEPKEPDCEARGDCEAPPECVMDDDCASGVCEAGRCDEEEESCEGDDCASPECVSNADCEDGKCVDEVCIPHECVYDEDCPLPTDRCENGVCVTHECLDDSHCEEGLCHIRECVIAECLYDSHCHEGWCIDRMCVDYECYTDEHCAGDSLCFAHQCLEPTVCLLGTDIETVQEGVDNPDCTIIEIPAGTHAVANVTINRSVMIRGAGSSETTLDAEELGRHLSLSASRIGLRLEGLRFIRGRANRGGSLELRSSSNSAALNDVRFEGNGAVESGGAIYARGELHATNCVFAENEVRLDENPTSTAGGGAIHASHSHLSLESCEFIENRVVNNGAWSILYGGAIHAEYSTLRLEDIQFIENEIVRLRTGFRDIRGGALSSRWSDTELRDVQFIENRLNNGAGCEECEGDAYGGALHQGEGRIFIDGFRAERNYATVGPKGRFMYGGAFHIEGSNDVHFRSGIVLENQLINGSSYRGAAIYMESATSGDTTATFELLQVAENSITCVDDGCRENASGSGASVYIQHRGGKESLRTLSLQMSELSFWGTRVHLESSSSFGPDVFITSAGNMTLLASNSTFSTGEALLGVRMPALSLHSSLPSAEYIPPNIAVDMRNVTLVNHFDERAAIVGYASWLARGGSFRVQMRNSILASAGPACSSSVPIVSDGWLVHPGDGSCEVEAGTGDLITSEPGLLPIADNGGDTMTHALADDSPVIGAGEPGGCTDGTDPIEVDQRGFPRTTPNCTPGAYSD